MNAPFSAAFLRRRFALHTRSAANRPAPGLAALLAAALIAVLTGLAAPAHAASAIETMPLWRLQVRITTGSAGTDGHPAIRFNSTATEVRTLNPASRSAFHAGHVDSYDLRLFRTPAEITMLRLGVAGGDGWCVKRVELWLNGRVAFAQDAVPGAACATITNGTYLQYSSAALRSNPAWRAYGTPPALPSQLSAADLRSAVSGVTGSAMLSAPSVYWDATAPLTTTEKTSHSIAVAFGIIVFDPSGIDAPFKVRITYDLLLFLGSDGRLHVIKTNASCCYHYAMSNAVVTQLDTALSTMTARPAPHDPLSFGVDIFGNTTWTYTPVVGP